MKTPALVHIAKLVTVDGGFGVHVGRTLVHITEGELHARAAANRLRVDIGAVITAALADQAQALAAERDAAVAAERDAAAAMLSRHAASLRRAAQAATRPEDRDRYTRDADLLERSAQDLADGSHVRTGGT